MSRAALVSSLVPFALATACAHVEPAADVSAPKVTGAPFAEWEASFLGDLAASDARIATRMSTKPSHAAVESLAAAAVIRGEKDVGIVGGGIDVFSWTARERALEALSARLAAQPDDGLETTRAEKVLLRRLLDGEALRVARERSPLSGSERARAIVATWGEPRSVGEVAARESLVARGLIDVIEEARAGHVTGPRTLELEDALDPVERLAVPEGYPEATKIIATLRVELGKSHAPGPSVPPSPATSLAAQLRTYLGEQEDRVSVVARLTHEEATLADEARAKLATLADAGHAARSIAGGNVELEVRCTPASADASPVRAMAPPPERALACEPRQLVATAKGELEETVATLVLHDDVAIALWALAEGDGATDLERTRLAHPLLADVPSDARDRLARAALVSGARAAAPGLAALVLDEEGPASRRARATRWLSFGDAPFDLVRAALNAAR